MQTQLNVSLLRGRRILDYRTLRHGEQLRFVPHGADWLDPAGEEAGEASDVVLDFRAGDPLVRLPAGAVGQLGRDQPEWVRGGEVRLPSGARGWIAVGETTLLVQTIPMLQPAPPRRLPKEARAWIRRTERPLILVLAGALVLELAFVNAVQRRPPIALDEPELEEEPVAPRPLVVVPKPPETPKVATPTPAPVHRTKSLATPAVAAHEKPAAEGGVDKAPLLVALESMSTLFKADSHAEVAAAFGQVLNRKIVGGPVTPGAKTIEEVSGTGTIGMLPTDGTPRPELKEHAQPHRPPLVDPGEPEPAPEQDPDDLQAVARQIRLRKGEIQSCYESSLKLNPSLAGRMVIQFDVGQTGAVEEVTYPEEQLPGDAVQNCIRLHARGWRLKPLKQSNSLSVAFPFVFSAAQ